MLEGRVPSTRNTKWQRVCGFPKNNLAEFLLLLYLDLSKSPVESQAWRHVSGILALGRLRQENLDFEVTLGYTSTLCLAQ